MPSHQPQVHCLSPHWTLNVQALAANLLYICSLPVTSLNSIVNHTLSLHGVVLPSWYPHKRKLAALCGHVIGGFCRSSQHVACTPVHAYPSVSLFRRDVLTHILLAFDGRTRTPELSPIYDALGFRVWTGLDQLRQVLSSGAAQIHPSLLTLLSDTYSKNAPCYVVTSLAQLHGILVTGQKGERLQHLLEHIGSGECFHKSDIFEGCGVVRGEISDMSGGPSLNELQFKFQLVRAALDSKVLKSVALVCRLNGVKLSDDDLTLPMHELASKVSHSIAFESLEAEASESRILESDYRTTLTSIRNSYPVIPDPHRKAQLISNFRSATSAATLRTRVCASCACRCFVSESEELPVTDVNLEPLKADPSIPRPLVDENHPLFEYALEPKGVDSIRGAIILCKTCLSSLRANKVPRLSYANGLFTGEVPPELAQLSPVEESMIARCRAKAMIIQLQYDGESNDASPAMQRGLKGNVLIFPQHPEVLPPMLPPPVDDILSHICVVFVGSQPPTREWLKTKAKPLAVRPDRVKAALLWLKEHNPLYKDVIVDEEVLKALPKDGSLLPFHVETVNPSTRRDATTAGYDPWKGAAETPLEPADPGRVPFNSVLISNIDQNTTSRELRDAAVRHIKEGRGNFFALPHDPVFAKTFNNAELFPLLYPTLFPRALAAPYGLAGKLPVSFENHIKHLISLDDTRFQEHPSFMFTAFNIIQRRAMLLSVSLRTKKAYFPEVAKSFAKVTSLAANEVLDKLNTSNATHIPAVADTDAQEQVLRLYDQVRLVSKTVHGSSEAKKQMRNEIRAMMTTLGVPSLYVTINPADVYNPVLQIFAGSEVDIDNMDGAFPFFDQACLVAKNPVITCKFFHAYIQAFISELLAFDEDGKLNPGKKRLGALGYTRAYYGCVEAQGRGSLHCHMVIWIEGSLNPDELKARLLDAMQADFRDRLAAYLDDIISNGVPPVDPDAELYSVPSDSHHPCAVRGVDPFDPSESTAFRRQKDLRNVVLKCQVHKHSATCYKYWRGPPEPKECRFGLEAGLEVKETTIDTETGELDLRRKDGLVNNFNDTIIEAVRNNMDIKFIGSGVSAKAITFYITDYISKSQLKAHVAFTALETAIYKLESSDEILDDAALRAKRLLQKCAYELLGRQELSSQQVASYLLGLPEDIKSHTFRNLYWVSFEAYLNDLLPSPECYPSADDSMVSNTDGDDGSDQEDENAGNDGSQELENADHAGVAAMPEEILEEDLTMIEPGVDTDTVVPRASQLRDYIYRGNTFDGISLWDFVAQVDKVKFAARDVNSVSKVCANNRDGVRLMQSVWAAYSDGILDLRTNSRPCSLFLSGHDEFHRSYLSVAHPSARRIPVPIGPALPRRDRPNLYPKYCRLMLMLFKPWRCVYDLRGNHNSWVSAFEDFKASPLFTEDVANVVRNMQVMHECKDSKDDDYKKRRDRLRSGRQTIQTSSLNIVPDDENPISNADDADNTREFALADFLSDLDVRRSRYIVQKQRTVRESLEVAAKCGMIKSSEMTSHGNHLSHISSPSAHMHKDVTEVDDNLEVLWRAEYEKRRKQKQRSLVNAHSPQVPLTNSDQPSSQDLYDDDRRPVIMDAAMGQRRISEWEAYDDTCRDLTMNPDQALALRIIVSQVARRGQSPLRMMVHGAAGTGKSRVIDGIRDFFERLGQSHRLRVASFMGIAAKNVGGETLHSLLNLQGLGKIKRNGDVHMDMISKWEGADWLIVDEVSMVSLNLLMQVNEALQWAKESEKPMGNVNVVFVGDLAQLPPVLQTRLYARIDAKSLCGTTTGQRNIFAKLLWLSFDTVIELKIPQRQTGSANMPFVQLLSRLREGKCTDADYALLQSRVLGPQHETEFSDPNGPWKYCPIVVYENGPKDALNEAKAIQFALDKNESLHWYHSRDYFGGKEVTNEETKAMLNLLDSGRTMSRLGKIPVCIGMPVLVSQNFDVQGGIVNGSYGTVKAVRYKKVGAGFRFLTTCVVELEGARSESMPGLDSNTFPILSDTVRIDLKDNTRRTKVVKVVDRRQVAVVPAFAMTAHRSQGQTLRNVVVDLESCHGSEAPYVMVSRATSLDALYVFRQFDKKRITCSQSQDLRLEMKRLAILDAKTRKEWNLTSDRSAGVIDNDAPDLVLSRVKDADLEASRVDTSFAASLLEAVQSRLDEILVDGAHSERRPKRKRRTRMDIDEL